MTSNGNCKEKGRVAAVESTGRAAPASGGSKSSGNSGDGIKKASVGLGSRASTGSAKGGVSRAASRITQSTKSTKSGTPSAQTFASPYPTSSRVLQPTSPHKLSRKSLFEETVVKEHDPSDTASSSYSGGPIRTSNKAGSGVKAVGKKGNGASTSKATNVDSSPFTLPRGEAASSSASTSSTLPSLFLPVPSSSKPVRAVEACETHSSCHDDHEEVSDSESDEEETTIRKGKVVRKGTIGLGRAKYRCQLCFFVPRIFSMPSRLDAHMILHSDERPHVCNYCDSAFKRPENLMKHMNAHSGIKPFGCDKCPSRFGQSDHLRDHMVVHTGEQAHVCDLCLRGFGLKSNLTRHRKTHFNYVKKHACEVCKKPFLTPAHLARHVNNPKIHDKPQRKSYTKNRIDSL